MNDFSFKRDFKYVNWKATLLLNGLRAASAGLVLGVPIGAVIMFSPEFDMSARLLALFLPLLYAIVLPLGLPVYLVIAIVCGYLAEAGVPFIGWVALFMGLIFAFGDPVLFFLHRSRPDLVPVERPAFFTPRVVLFVLDPDRIPGNVQTA